MNNLNITISCQLKREEDWSGWPLITPTLNRMRFAGECSYVDDLPNPRVGPLKATTSGTHHNLLCNFFPNPDSFVYGDFITPIPCWLTAVCTVFQVPRFLTLLTVTYELIHLKVLKLVFVNVVFELKRLNVVFSNGKWLRLQCTTDAAGCMTNTLQVVLHPSSHSLSLKNCRQVRIDARVLRLHFVSTGTLWHRFDVWN